MKVVKMSKNYVSSGKVFKTNEEYELQDEVLKKESCNCSGGSSIKVTYYRISVNGKIYDINSNAATIITKAAPDAILSPEDYYRTLHGTTVGDNNNYDLIRNKPDIERIMKQVNNIKMLNGIPGALLGKQ